MLITADVIRNLSVAGNRLSQVPLPFRIEMKRKEKTDVGIYIRTDNRN